MNKYILSFNLNNKTKSIIKKEKEKQILFKSVDEEDLRKVYIKNLTISSQQSLIPRTLPCCIESYFSDRSVNTFLKSIYENKDFEIFVNNEAYYCKPISMDVMINIEKEPFINSHFNFDINLDKSTSFVNLEAKTESCDNPQVDYEKLEKDLYSQKIIRVENQIDYNKCEIDLGILRFNYDSVNIYPIITQLQIKFGLHETICGKVKCTIDKNFKIIEFLKDLNNSLIHSYDLIKFTKAKTDDAIEKIQSAFNISIQKEALFCIENNQCQIKTSIENNKISYNKNELELSFAITKEEKTNWRLEEGVLK